MIAKINRSEKDVFYTDYDINLIKSKGQQFLHYAPYYILEKGFSKSEVENLSKILSAYDQKAYKGSVIGSNPDEAIKNNYRNSDVCFIENNTNLEFEMFNDKIIDTAEKVNSQVFNLELTSTMDPQYTIYNETMHFDWHPDGPFGVLDARGLNCIPNHLQWRKLTCVTMLNDEDTYEGGDFQIFSPSTSPENCIHTIRLDAGSMIFFPSYTAHRVTPVTRGTRKTLVHWFCGPRWR